MFSLEVNTAERYRPKTCPPGQPQTINRDRDSDSYSTQSLLSFTDQRVREARLLAFYCLDDKNTESLTTPFITRNLAYFNDVFPAHLWDTDVILTDGGYDRFTGVVQNIKALAADGGV